MLHLYTIQKIFIMLHYALTAVVDSCSVLDLYIVQDLVDCKCPDMYKLKCTINTGVYPHLCSNSGRSECLLPEWR